MTIMSSSGILEDININKIRHSSFKIRESSVGLKDLADSIRQFGLLQPIIVRPMLNEYEVVAGNRRLAASSQLRLRKISCHIMELSDKEAFEVGLIENIQHHTMNAIEEATAFSKYVDDFGWGGVSELARQIGKSQEFVTRRIQLLDLPEIIKGGIISRRITPSVASELLPLKNENYIEDVGQFVLTNSISKTQARNFVRKAREKDDENLSDTDSLDFSDSRKKACAKLSNYYDDFDIVEKALMRAIALMKSTLVDFDEIINSVNENWILAELLMQYRLIIHGDIDTFLHLRKKLKSKIPRGFAHTIFSNGMKVDGDSLKESRLNTVHHWARFLA